jgi:hypothetical protein
MFTPNTAAKHGQGFGYNCVTLDGKVFSEEDTCQCTHCNTTIFIDPKEPPPWCSNCGQYHCGTQDGIRDCFICAPFMRTLERKEAECRNRILLWRAADNV